MQPSTGPVSATRNLNILALDTSTERLALGLQAPGGPFTVLAEGGAQASATLLPQVHALLARAGLRMADLDAIAFGQGPGAFTGLRTACAVAQGLAFGLGKPVLPIDSLLIVAEDARLQHFAGADTLDIAVAMDARMNEVYAGRYRWAHGAWHTQQAAGLYALPALAQVWSRALTAARAAAGTAAGTAAETQAGAQPAAQPAAQPETDTGVQAIAGSALAAFGDRVQWPAGARCIPQEHDRATALLNLAVQAARAGAGLDAALALPLYLRDKVAQTTQERDALRTAQPAPAAAP